MRKILKKTQEKIYSIWRKAKQHISSLVGGQFKKSEYNDYRNFDWYYHTSWFDRKWFKHKFKRFIMRNVYKLIDKLDDVLFNKYHETYYCNFNMYADKHGLKILELPLIVKIKNGENIKYISDLIRDEIKTLFGFSTCYADNEIKILDDEQLNVIKCDVERKFASYIGIGKIKFNTIRFQQFHHKLIDAIPLTINPEDIPLGYKMLNMQDIEFGIIETKNKKYLIDKSIEYQIFIQFNKVVKDVIDDEPKEVRINRIRELMGLMVDKIEDK